MYLMWSVSCCLTGTLLIGLRSVIRGRRLRQSCQHRQRLLIRAMRGPALNGGRGGILLVQPVREELP